MCLFYRLCSPPWTWIPLLLHLISLLTCCWLFEMIALVVILQLIVLVFAQLPVAELAVHRTILPHVDDIFILVILVVVVVLTRPPVVKVHQLLLM